MFITGILWPILSTRRFNLFLTSTGNNNYGIILKMEIIVWSSRLVLPWTMGISIWELPLGWSSPLSLINVGSLLLLLSPTISEPLLLALQVLAKQSQPKIWPKGWQESALFSIVPTRLLHKWWVNCFLGWHSRELGLVWTNLTELILAGPKSALIGTKLSNPLVISSCICIRWYFMLLLTSKPALSEFLLTASTIAA